MLKNILLFIVLPLGVLALAGYYWLGGFNEITIEVIKEAPRPVMGKAYRGQYGDLALSEMFVRAKQLQQEGAVPGVLTVINRDTTSASDKSVNQFIGITLNAPLATLPEGYQVDTMAAGTYLRAKMHAHPVVMPKPKAVNEQMAAYAAQHRLTVSGLPIEFYRASDTVWVEMAVRE